MTRTRRHRLLLLLGACVVQSSIVSAQSQDTVTYYHTDAIGSVRMITDANMQVVARYDFLPFGEPWSPAPLPDVRQFAGKERDAENGFDYFGARYYAQTMGRFTTIDPILDVDVALINPQRWNRYAYVSNNPLAKVDPNGQYEVDVHYHLTRVLAMAAGFTTNSADAIAGANQLVDIHPVTEPFRDFDARSDFHFTSEARREQAWQSAIESRSPGMVGVYLHLQQDSFAHVGYGPAVGHLRAGHSPDKTYNDVPKANLMARDTYTRLTDAMSRIQRSGVIVPWEKIAPYVSKFNAERDLRRKYEILDELSGFIEDYKR